MAAWSRLSPWDCSRSRLRSEAKSDPDDIDMLQDLIVAAVNAVSRPRRRRLSRDGKVIRRSNMPFKF